MKSSVWFLWVSVLVGVGGTLYGYDIGVISGALLLINHTIPMTATQTGVMVGAVLWGGLIGTLLAGPIADSLGRRFLIMLSCMVFILGATFIVSAHQFATLLVARVFLGIGVGIVAVAVPLYVTELVPIEHRGKYVTFFQLFLTFGIVLAYVVDYYFLPTGNWHAMFMVILIPATILLVGMFFFPESPRWLMIKQKESRAHDILVQLYGRTRADNIQQEIRTSLSEVAPCWRDFMSRSVMLPLLLSIFIAMLNQWTGINSFLQYAPVLLKQAGIASNQIAMLGSIGIGLLNFVVTVIALLLVDRVGRRALLLTGLIGVVASEVFLGALYFMPLSPMANGLASLVGLFAFIVFFAMGPGVVIWLVFSELLPTAFREKGIALCLFFNSCAGALLASFFLDIQHLMGAGDSYFLFAGSSLCYLLLVYFALPETKGRTLEEIQRHFNPKVCGEG